MPSAWQVGTVRPSPQKINRWLAALAPMAWGLQPQPATIERLRAIDWAELIDDAISIQIFKTFNSIASQLLRYITRITAIWPLVKNFREHSTCWKHKARLLFLNRVHVFFSKRGAEAASILYSSCRFHTVISLTIILWAYTLLSRFTRDLSLLHVKFVIIRI